MTGATLRLGRLFGTEVKLDLSWFIIAGLITWSLAGHYFPMAHPGWSVGVYWLIGAVTALLFFASVLAHELAHSIVSRAFGIPVRDITLFIFGGAAALQREPRTPRQELLTAIVGPVTSLVLAGGFGVLWWLSRDVLDPLHALAGWLAWINLALALFNLIPGFPLDGGRVFRAIVWNVTGDLPRATRIAAGLGQMVGLGLIAWGVWQIFGGNWANGLWIAFIGWFLNSAAQASGQQVALESVLAGHTVREVMMTDCPQVPGRLTLDVVVEQVMLPSGRRCFPVAEAGELRGLLTLTAVQRVPRSRWTTTRVQDVMVPLAALQTARPDDPLISVLDRMASEDINQLPVMDGGRLVGMVARDNLLTFIQLRSQARA